MLGKRDKNYTTSKLKESSGYCLDKDTIQAYTAIVNFISDLTNENDAAFEFPHAVMLICFLKYKQGAYTVSLWLDVCPDYIAKAEVNHLYGL